jgi:hypothetical protein
MGFNRFNEWMLREELKVEEVKSEEARGEKENFFPSPTLPLSHSRPLALSHSSPLSTQNSKLTHGQVFVSTKSLVRVEEF